MGRIRSIKPSFFLDEDLAELPFEHRLAFVGLWTMADGAGRLRDRPKRIKVELFPYDDVNMQQILECLAEKGFIVRYKVGDGCFIQVTNFRKHQRISGKECSEQSEFPECETGKQRGSSGEAVIAQEGKGKEGVRKGGEIQIRPLESKPTLRTNPDELPPDGLSELEYSRMFWEGLGMPVTKPLLEVGGASILSFSRNQKLPMNAGVVLLLARAQIARDAGATINRFWFEDGKHLREGVGNGQPSKTQQRIARNRENLTEGLRQFEAGREVAGSDGADLPDGSPLPRTHKALAGNVGSVSLALD
jgi:hypothetical protein